MNHIARTPPAKIRARIHDNALKRVTRIYASTLADVLTETLQNSRRGGATGVRISVGTLTDQPGGETRFTVTIADDGTGIADPAVLLSFGENGWSDDLVRREDAAGFGFASLSRRGGIWRSSASLLRRVWLMSVGWHRHSRIRVRDYRERSARWVAFCSARSLTSMRRSADWKRSSAPARVRTSRRHGS